MILRQTERRVGSRVLTMVALLLVAAMAMLALAHPASAATFSVTKTADTNDGVCNSDCSLREAVSAANAAAGADTITLPAGTYQLTLANASGTNEDNNATGDLDIKDSLTINGAGSGTTIIQAGTNTTNGIDKVIALNPICTSPINVTIGGVTVRYGRNSQPYGAADFSFTGGGIDWCANGSGSVFTLSNSVVSDNTNVNGYGGGLNVDSSNATSFTVNLTNDTFQNNRTLSTVNEDNGGAINLFGSGLNVNVTDSTFTGNSTGNPNSGGGAIYFRPTTNSSLSISNSTFSSNTAPGIGGAIATNTFGAGTTTTIQNSTFTGNTATNSFGGALYFGSTNLNTTPFSLSHLKITGNTAGQAGGGVYVGSSNVTMSKSLIVGNSAPDGSGLHKSVDASTATVSNNWWGCSTGPSAAPCDTASITPPPPSPGGTLNFTPWYRDQLTASTSPIVTNQSTSLTASFLTNSAGSSVPLGDLAEIIGRSVNWAATHGNLSSTQGAVQATGTATGSFQATAAGTAVISAKVDNDKTSPVSSNVLSLTVNKADTTTAITNGASLSGTDSVTGEPVAVNYSVTGAFGNSPTAPTGNVTVSDGTGDSCTGTVAAGTCTITPTTAGNKTLTAKYQGDDNFNASPVSTGVSHTVNKADTTTTISSDNPDPSVVGQPVTVNYGVTVNAPGGGTPTGNVTVTDGTHSCTATVAAGSCTITFTSVGAMTLTATYQGDDNYKASPASTSVTHTVNKADTTTTIKSDDPDPSNVGQAVTVDYTVTVNAPGDGTPTGNVTVSDGTDSCTGTVAAGTCDITLSTPGARTLTANYDGDTNFNKSSDTESHTVNRFATTTRISSDDPDPSVVGQAVTVQYSVDPTGGSGTPTGNVTVSDGTQSCTATVAAGSCDITFTSAGAKSLTATYAGNNNFSGSTSAAETHQVDKADTTTTITSDNPDPSRGGQAVTVDYTVTVKEPGDGTPTGNVTVSDGVDSCTGPVAAGTCDITLTTDGTRTLTATYGGDDNFNKSTSDTVSHMVDNTAPTVEINQASGQADPTSISPVNFTVEFSEAVSGFTDGDVTLSGTAGATTAVVTEKAPNDGTAYDVAVSGMTSDGTVIASIPANVAKDLAGNDNSASTSTDNTVTFIVNSQPTAVDDSYSTNENTTLNVSAPGVLANDTDTEGDTLSAVLVSGPSHGSLSLNQDGSFTYTPGANYNGADSFTYKAKDASSESGQARVEITVTANDAPIVAVAAGGECPSNTRADGIINLSLSDDQGASNLSLSATSSNHALVPDENITLEGSGQERTIEVRAVAKESGTTRITIKVNDQGSLGAQQIITVKVGTNKVNTMSGTAGADMLFGLNADDTLEGLDGNDLLCRGYGDDVLKGGDGEDTMRGGPGNDTLSGGSANDSLRGGGDNDTLSGGAGSDSFSGGPGKDVAIDFNASEGDTKDSTIP